MITLRRRLRLDEVGNDRGMAMAIVLIFGMVILVMAATAVGVAVSGLQKSTRESSWSAAIAAAYAGVEDYQARLANDASYFRYGNVAAPFSRSSTSLVMPAATSKNPAFSLGTSPTDWATVPGSGGGSKFRYEVDNSSYASKGSLRLRATGTSGGVVRSVVAEVRQKGFIDYLYFTDQENPDPDLVDTSATACVDKYAWQGRPTTCRSIAFGSGDVLKGDVHSNDTMRICQATFDTSVTTSSTTYSTGLRYLATDSNGNKCTGQAFPNRASQPGFRETYDLPRTNTEQKRETRYDLEFDATSPVLSPGCLYTGPTSVVFNANGTMTVKSPNTKFVQTAGDTASDARTNNDLCGSVAALRSTAGATVPVLDNNLLYVQDIPTSPSDKNTTPVSQIPENSCAGNGVGFPMAAESAPGADVTGRGSCAYDARKGDVFVKGTLKGSTTIASQNYLYVTGDLKYADQSRDMLGLSPAGTAWIYNPVNSSNGTILSTTERVNEVNAAIISLKHSITVQNYDRGGARGTLTIRGALGQKFRGIVSSGSNGYIKNYIYDSRLKTLSPPKFISPVTTVYGITTVTEVSAAFTAKGAAT